MSDAQGDAPNPFGQRLNIRHLLDNVPPPMDEVLPGMPTGTVGMLAGAGGVGKTMLELQMAMSIATGMPVLGGLFGDSVASMRKPAKVVVVTAEESAEVIWRRLRSISRQLAADARRFAPELSRDELRERLHENLHLFPMGGQARVTLLGEDLQATRDAEHLSKASEGARLVIVDPIRQFHHDDENNSRAMAAFVHVASKLAAQSGAAWLLSHHMNRASTTQGFSDSPGAARGSTALTDGARCQYNLSRLTKDSAKAFRVVEARRRQFVAIELVKANYTAERAPVLLERGSDGVLIPAGIQQ